MANSDATLYSMKELAQLTRIPARTIRNYMKLKLVPGPTFGGSARRYPRSTLGKLAAIRQWRVDQGLMTYHLRAVLKEREDDEEEWEAWAEEVHPLAPPEPEPVAPPAPPTPTDALAAVALSTGAPAPAADAIGEKWHHLPLMPGLTLLVREGVSEMTANAAREIHRRYRVG